MSSVSVVGQRDPDGKLADMVALKELCQKNSVTYPDELKEYFKGTDALEMKDAEGTIREATEVGLNELKIDGLLDGDVEYGCNMIVDLTKLPDDIKKIRIYVS